MTNPLQAVMISALLASFMLAGLVFIIDDFNRGYSAADYSTANISGIEKLDELSDEVDELRSETVEGGDVSTLESVASFFETAFTVGKFVFTGGAFAVVDGMLRDFQRFTDIPFIVYQLLAALLGVFMVFGLIKMVTGR